MLYVQPLRVLLNIKVTIELRNRLSGINVTVQVKTFEENEGIAGLGNDPFVSVVILYCSKFLVIKFCIATRLYPNKCCFFSTLAT